MYRSSSILFYVLLLWTLVAAFETTADSKQCSDEGHTNQPSKRSLFLLPGPEQAKSLLSWALQIKNKGKAFPKTKSSIFYAAMGKRQQSAENSDRKSIIEALNQRLV